MNEEDQYALLIDAENISPKYIQTIFDEVSTYGITTYRRIYGDWTQTQNNRWKRTLLDASITPIQQYSYTNGKNSSDSALIIDAMDILYTMTVDGFVLVSSDSDFTRLASRLRESGMNVIGMGESKTPPAFIAACNTFKYLDILYSDHQNDAEDGPDSQENSGANASLVNGEKSQSAHREKAQPLTKFSTLRRAIRSIIMENSDEDSWISLADLGNQLSKRFPDFDVRNYGYKKLAPFIESMESLETERRQITKEGGKQVFVRIKQ